VIFQQVHEIKVNLCGEEKYRQILFVRCLSKSANCGEKSAPQSLV